MYPSDCIITMIIFVIRQHNVTCLPFTKIYILYIHDRLVFCLIFMYMSTSVCQFDWLRETIAIWENRPDQGSTIIHFMLLYFLHAFAFFRDVVMCDLYGFNLPHKLSLVAFRGFREDQLFIAIRFAGINVICVPWYTMKSARWMCTPLYVKVRLVYQNNL